MSVGVVSQHDLPGRSPENQASEEDNATQDVVAMQVTIVCLVLLNLLPAMAGAIGTLTTTQSDSEHSPGTQEAVVERSADQARPYCSWSVG